MWLVESGQFNLERVNVSLNKKSGSREPWRGWGEIGEQKQIEATQLLSPAHSWHLQQSGFCEDKVKHSLPGA